MKKIALFVFVFSTLIGVAQNKSSVETRALMHNFKQAKSIDKMSQNYLTAILYTTTRTLPR